MNPGFESKPPGNGPLRLAYKVSIGFFVAMLFATLLFTILGGLAKASHHYPFGISYYKILLALLAVTAIALFFIILSKRWLQASELSTAAVAKK